MNLSEVINFLLPQWNDPIQLIFFFVILSMMIYAVTGAHRAAHPSEWEKKWNRGTANTDDDLDIEHGSVTDLWNAVATAHEKLAEIMPGLLLVVGLLGTFLGLGLALNHASNILGQQDATTASGAANSMNDLMGLLKGLGTKFKTSTWGICGFVILKIWSEVTRFDEKRLAWVIGKVKTELQVRRGQKEVEAASRQQALFNQIQGVSIAIVEGFKSAMEVSSRNTQTYLTEGLSGLNISLGGIQDASKATSASMADFTRNTTGIVQQMAGAAQGMEAGADKVSAAAEDLNKAVGDFSTQFTDVLDKVRKDLSASIQDMSNSSAQTMKEGSQKLEGATKEISQALASLSGDIKLTLGEVKSSIGDSLKIQNKAFSLFETTSQTLNEQIEKSTQTANMMKDSIESGLEGVSNSSRNMASLAKQMEAVAAKLGEEVIQKVKSQSEKMDIPSLSKSPSLKI